MLANPKRTKDEIVQWIRSYFESNGPGCDAVVGISGGKDSSVVAALCLEPAAGEGHISKVLREHYPNSQIISTDLVQRDDRFGCGIVGGVDFLTENYPEKFNNVITNPPFSLAKEFAEKALEVSTGKVILFAKIQFLEGRQRKDFFATHPPKAVYVFSKRVNPLRNGLEVDENGKPWSSTMCFAWFVWEHGYTGEPCIRWI